MSKSNAAKSDPRAEHTGPTRSYVNVRTLCRRRTFWIDAQQNCMGTSNRAICLFDLATIGILICRVKAVAAGQHLDLVVR
jgi:hypothetical protein